MEELEVINSALKILQSGKTILPASYGIHIKVLDTCTGSILSNPLDEKTLAALAGVWAPLLELEHHFEVITIGSWLEQQRVMVTNWLVWDWLDRTVLGAAQDTLRRAQDTSSTSWVSRLTWKINAMLLSCQLKWSLD